MKATIILFAGCMILFTQTIQAQDVFGRYLMDKNGHIVDLKLSYAFNAIPVFTGNNIGYQATYITNYKLFGDGIQDPIIGFSTSLSLSYASYMSDKSQIRYGLMQDGLLNFVPSLYISVLPEPGSRFRLFANAAGGIKGFAKLASVDPTTVGYIDSDNNFGITEQWVFDLGAGIDYDRMFSLYFKYGRAWNDFNTTTRDYYKKYINPNTTFLSYLHVKGNFRLSDNFSTFIEWSGYNHSFENESMARVGVAYIPWSNSEFNTKKAKGLSERLLALKSKIQNGDSTYGDFQTDKNSLVAEVDALIARVAMMKSKKEYLEVSKDVENLTKEVERLEQKIEKGIKKEKDTKSQIQN